VATNFHFEHSVSFSPEASTEILRQIPALPGVFALRGEDAAAEPYLTRAADIRRRITRLLAPPEVSADGTPVQSRRLNLRDRVRSIAYTVTGSEFASLLLLYDASAAVFGADQARRRLRLHPPCFLRLTLEHAHPRVYSTNRLSKRNLAQTYGPFPSRAAAERYCDAVLDLFKLRRCCEDLEVSPSHPGCAYGEMKKCMAPCNTSCTADEYAAEARAVEAFFQTRGESMLAEIAAARDRASAQMEFEQAAALHQQHEKVKAVAALASELVRPVPQLRGVIVQPTPKRPEATDAQEAAVFLLEAGCILGPEPLSTLGVRAVKEQTSVGSSLFAQPLMLQAVPLEDGAAATAQTALDSPEIRAERALEALAARANGTADIPTLGDHLSLLRRWYYRPEKQRVGEIFFPYEDGSWPIRRILRGAARMALGDPAAMAETRREAAPPAAEEIKTRILHEGRPDVERAVPVVKRPRKRAQSAAAHSATSDDLSSASPSVVD
jgi:excinuclease ABC subunit C